MKHYGDILNLSGYNVPPVDCIIGGSPCQDLSVAGLRKGLSAERSGLFMEQIRIIKEMRESDRKNGRSDDACRPRFLVWENVPGALSSPGKKNGEDHAGEDFQAVLTEIVKVIKPDTPIVPLPKNRKWPKAGCLMGYGDSGQHFSIAWRVHDAQFWGKTFRDGDTGDVLRLGTPQRRKRISLVADFGGLTAPEICFEPACVPGDSDPGCEKRKDSPRSSKESTPGTGDTKERVIETENNTQNKNIDLSPTVDNQPVFCLQGNGIDRSDTSGCNGRRSKK